LKQCSAFLYSPLLTLLVALLTLLQFVHLKYEFLLKYEFFYFLFDKQIASRHSYWTAQIKRTDVERKN